MTNGPYRPSGQLFTHLNIEPSLLFHLSFARVKNMEKDSKSHAEDSLPLRQQGQTRPRGSNGPSHWLTGVVLFFAASFWVTTIWPALTIGEHSCKHELSVEQRATKILQKHPLIGQCCLHPPTFLHSPLTRCRADGHNDLMIFIRGKYHNHIYDNDFQEKFEHGGLPQHVDIPRLEQGLQGGAFWSAFYVCPTGENTTDFSRERYSTSKSCLRFPS